VLLLPVAERPPLRRSYKHHIIIFYQPGEAQGEVVQVIAMEWQPIEHTRGHLQMNLLVVIM
jgi:hypothetical protein